MTYDSWREMKGPTGYPAVHTPVTQDVLMMGIVYAFGAVLLSALIIFPGFRGVQMWCHLIRSLVAVSILAATVVCNYGNSWEVGTLYTSVPYQPGSGHVISASIGVHIGLRWVNITLKADPEMQEIPDSSSEERINYNERFHWNGQAWSLGNEGLAESDGQMNKDFLKARDKGLPWAILWVAEYLTLDGGAFRWGRQYQQAGFFAHCCLWLAFVAWLLTLFSLYMVKLYGGYMSISTGALLLITNVIYATIRNPVPLSVPFEEGRLDLQWGWCFWTCLVTGITTVSIGALVIALGEFAPNRLNMVLNIDPGIDKECVEEGDDENSDVFDDQCADTDDMLASKPRCTSMSPGVSPVTPFSQGLAYPPGYSSGLTPGAAPHTPGSHSPYFPVLPSLAPGFHPLGGGNSGSLSNTTGSGPLSPIDETQATDPDNFQSVVSLPKTPKVRRFVVRRKTSNFLRSVRKTPRSRKPDFDRSASYPGRVDQRLETQNPVYSDVISALIERQTSENKESIELTAV